MVGINASKFIVVMIAVCLVVLLLAMAPLGCNRSEQAGCPIRAVWAHAIRGEYDAIKDLYLDGSTDGDGEARVIREACIDALAAMDDDGAMLALAGILRAQTIPDLTIAQRIVASSDSPAMETIYELAESEHLEIRHKIALAFNCCDFTKCGSRAVDLLCKMLRDEERGVSTMATHALGKVPASMPEQYGKAKRSLIEYYQRPESLPDDNIMLDLCGAFESLEGHDVQEFIRWLLARAKNPPRDHVFALLHKLPEREAIGYVEKYSRSNDEIDRAWAAGTACDMSSPRAIPVIRMLSGDSCDRVRAGIAGSLRKPFEGREEIVLGMANDASQKVRRASAWSLATLSSPAAQRALMSLIRSKDRDVSLWAILGLSQSPQVFTFDYLRPEITELAQSRTAEHRRLAVALIRAYSIDGMDDVLLRLTEDRSLMVRRAAYQGIYKVNPDRLREIVQQ